MSDADWNVALAAFRATLPRKSDKGRDDRKFPEEVHFFAVRNVTWRALLTAFGNSNSICKQFWRLSQLGAFEACLIPWRAPRHRPIWCRCSTPPRLAPRLCGGRKKGQNDQALGRSRSGFSIEIHSNPDFNGLPIAFYLMPGQASDSRLIPALLDLGPEVAPRAVVDDKGFDSEASRADPRSRGICPVIPFKASGKNLPAFFPKTLYRGHARIEQCVGKLKRLKRFRPCCEKTAQTYGSIVAFGLTMMLVKSAHVA